MGPESSPKCPCGKSVIAERLRQLTEGKYGSARALSEASGYTDSAVARYLRGERDQPVDFLVCVALHYNVSLNWLILGRGGKDLIIEAATSDLDTGAFDIPPSTSDETASSSGDGSIVRDRQRHAAIEGLREELMVHLMRLGPDAVEALAALVCALRNEEPGDAAEAK